MIILNKGTEIGLLGGSISERDVNGLGESTSDDRNEERSFDCHM